MRVPFRRWWKTMMRADSFCEGLRANWIRVGSTILTERLLSDRRHGLFCNRRFTGFDRRGKRKEKASRNVGIWFGFVINIFVYISPFPFFIYLFIRIWKFYSNMKNFINPRVAICIYSFLKFIYDWLKRDVFCCYSFLIYIDLTKFKTGDREWIRWNGFTYN